MSKDTKEVNEKIVDLMLLHQLEETKHYIEFYQNQLHFYNKMYDSHLELEPWKIFKKKYAQWEKTKKNWQRVTTLPIILRKPKHILVVIITMHQIMIKEEEKTKQNFQILSKSVNLHSTH